MNDKNNIKYILTDIEGTTTSISFVTEVLFPYFNENIHLLKNYEQDEEVKKAFAQTVTIAKEKEGKDLVSTEEIIEQLLVWSKADLKITPLKTLQGILWKAAYESGQIKGHIYPEVANKLKEWKNQGLQLGVFSSGSVSAQKLLFGFSEEGDLTPCFSNYFDTNTGGKRETETYFKIAEILNLLPNQILFLSDIKEELVSAKQAGLQTLQLVRPGTISNWDNTVSNFNEINLG